MADKSFNRQLSKTPVICRDCGECCERRSNRQIRCVPCQKAKAARDMREFRAKDASGYRAKRRSYYHQNGDKIREYQRDSYRKKVASPDALERIRADARKNWIARTTRRGGLTDGQVNREQRLARRRAKAASETPEQAEERRKRQREYYARTKEKQRQKARHRYAQNALHMRVSSSIRRMLRGGKNGLSTEPLLGFSIEQFRQHIERQFLPGMSWKNMARWHIDHIQPVASFSFETPDCEGFKACWALTNLRPLWATANQSKGAQRTHLI